MISCMGTESLVFAGQLFLHCFHDVVRHERFAVVLADVAVRDEAGFAAQVARELPAVVVLDDDGVAGALQDCSRMASPCSGTIQRIWR